MKSQAAAVTRCDDCGTALSEIHQSSEGRWLCLTCFGKADVLEGSYVSLNPVTASVTLKPHPYPQDTPPSSDGRPDIEVYLEEWRARRIEPVPVALPPLPQNATDTMVRVATFYRLVRGLRLEVCDDEPVPFGSDWVASKLGAPRVTGRTVSRVLKRLVQAGVLERGEDLRVNEKRFVYTYLPGQPSEGLRAVE